MERYEIDEKLAAACACLEKAREQIQDITLEDMGAYSLEGVMDVFRSMGEDNSFLISLLEEPAEGLSVPQFEVLLEPIDDPDDDDPDDDDPDEETDPDEEPDTEEETGPSEVEDEPAAELKTAS
jgi:hypothetical protein